MTFTGPEIALNLFPLYQALREQGPSPFLVESLRPGRSLSLLGFAPQIWLEVREGVLYRNGKRWGEALDIFNFLDTGLSRRLIPFWGGFFSYEFARHFGLPTRAPASEIPEAAFAYYSHGWLQRGDCQTKHPALDLPELAFGAANEYQQGILAIQELIRAGQVYQVNFSRRASAPWGDLDLAKAYAAIRTTNPSPYLGLWQGSGWGIVSGSPELLFEVKNGKIRTRPIAGTRPRGQSQAEDDELSQELLNNPKERAEHLMLLDLARNDLTRVAEPGSVTVSEAFTTEYYSHVMHLVSEVQARTQAPLIKIMAALFPGASITGAPKERVMAAIAELEAVPRGPYTGSLGVISGAKTVFNILIRSLWQGGDSLFLSSGAGIVIDSVGEAETQETNFKAAAWFKAIPGALPRLPEPRRPAPKNRPSRSCRARVCFLEAHDSFSYNLIEYLRELGALVEVVDHNQPPVWGDATHLLLGPGPGNPASSGQMLNWARWAYREGIPTLGVCLGHQALGEVLGGQVMRTRPVHGKVERIFHRGQGIFRGLNLPARFVRYHSLVVSGVEDYRLAWNQEGLIMAIGHPKMPLFGVQFHPESLASEEGFLLLENFLR